jgi:glutamate dehydrogenase
MALTWSEQLQTSLIQKHGKKNGQLLFDKYSSSFSREYTDDYSTEQAVIDIDFIENLSAEKPLLASLYYLTNTNEQTLHLRIFQWQSPIALSDILPILENFDLRTYNEAQHHLTLGSNTVIWVSDFTLSYNKGSLDIATTKTFFEDAFLQIQRNECENDGFNKLILGAALSWRDIIILRAYAKYLRQVGFRFSQPYIEATLASNASITKDLIELFKTLHDPAKQNKATLHASEIEQRIEKSLEAVASLDHDRIFRRFLTLIKATLRTNYFQTTETGAPKTHLSLKLSSQQIPELPLPVPLYEVFVYAPHFEAIHLRNTKVARGGIRWSDRSEDFRTEILGLMKAQKVKNSIIVPSGAKGGFVLKRNANKEEVINCYQTFIRGLLDITDNIVEKNIIHPKQVVCHDDNDPYLVVAADKGTASFSDIANGISKDYGFWLGDAFASGGSTGYDHKKMGITARGAWESIKRHFRELHIDVLNTDINVVGLGDMSGDVFGNGMLYSKHIKLVAAIDHRHIFIDPHPDPARSYEERLRLFQLPASSWENYNSELISPGGGVFKRTLKSIPITPEMQALFHISETSLTPNDLIKALLKAPVDLLYNGGIGTYVKASTESHIDVGDRTNDYCRVNGNELRCRVVGEGGNLGFTQLGRVEYALTGGLINTDFIDNSAGVDCSDHEVNLKILLDNEIQKGHLSYQKRNELLASATQEVASLVLSDNYNQALVMSFSAYHAKRNIGLHQNYIKDLEAQGVLNRRVEYLPDDKTLIERKSAGLGLTRPELAVLLAYSKIQIKSEILNSALTQDPYLSQMVETAFPESLRKKYKHAMDDHRLRDNIIATQLSNHVVNQMGFTFVYRLQIETGASVEEIIRAFTVASQIFGTAKLQKSIEALDYSIPLSEQYDMLYYIRHLLNLSTRWFLRSSYLKSDLYTLIERFSAHIPVLEEMVPTLMAGYTQQYLQTLVAKFAQAGLPTELAHKIATYRAMYTSLNIIDIAAKHHLDVAKTAKVYFCAGERMNLLWFRDQIAADSRDGHWNILARLTLRDELDICQREFTIAVILANKKEPSVTKLIDNWTKQNSRSLTRWEKILEMLNSSTQMEYTTVFIALRELHNLIATTSEQ